MSADKPVVPKDPVQTRSLSLPIFIASAILMGAVVLAGYDEFVGRRPYKQYQHDFITVYQNFLEDLLPKQEAKYQKIIGSAEYKAILAQRDRVRKEGAERIAPLSQERDVIAAELDVLRAAQKPKKSFFDSVRYKLETARTDEARSRLKEEMANLRDERIPVTLPDGQTIEPSYKELGARIAERQADKGRIEKSLAEIQGAEAKFTKQLDALVAKQLGGPTPAAVEKLMEKANAGLLGSEGKAVNDVLQIHISHEKLDGWVDRCESCHAGAREPVEMGVGEIMATTEAGVDPDTAVVYTSHPRKELLAVHDPERFGCSMCHNGNGRSVTSVELAHGYNKHWLYPLFPRENFEAGCVQCHLGDAKLPGAETFNHARKVFYDRGCWGCHKYEGYNTSVDEAATLANERTAILARQDKMRVESTLLESVIEKQKSAMELGKLETRVRELDGQLADLAIERQRVGPNLKNLRAKVKRDWLLAWLLDPAAYRPTTKMPSFFENQDEATKLDHATKIAAFLWQRATDPAEILKDNFQRGDAAHGKELFSQRGCLGCHTIQDGAETMGDGFAADLSRIGEKHNYAFTVKWILQPDNGVMPNLRLTVAEAQDLATYLTSLSSGRSYEPTPQIEDTSLVDEGRKLLLHYGCAGCHEVGDGLENEKGIGTELTNEGSKPKERLDFGRLEHGFKKAGDYSHKAFFENKLRKPGIYGLGKIYDEDQKGLDKLKMPNFRLAENDITALTTLLLGSVDSAIPEEWRFSPDGRARDIQKGWWVVQKYNCTGCHQIEPGVEPPLWSMAQYQGKDEYQRESESRRPPTLVSLGARVNATWLAKFLRNPSLTHDDAAMHGNGVRPYLKIRMPTFRFSEREIETLVRFFQAIDSQPIPYVAPDLEPLDDQELAGARDLYRDVKCFLCHATGNPTRDQTMSAPNLLVAREKLKYDWMGRWFVQPQSIIPYTKMPVNFSEEWKVTSTSGAEMIGTDLAWSDDHSSARMKLSNGENIRLKGDEVKSAEFLRHVGTTIPASLAGFTGDHVDLLARYLLFHYDEKEVEATTPKQ